MYVCMCVCLYVCMYGHTKPGEHSFMGTSVSNKKFSQVWNSVFPGLCPKIAAPWYLLWISSGEILDMNIIWWEGNSVKPAVEAVTSHLTQACHWTLIMDTKRVVYVLYKLTSLFSIFHLLSSFQVLWQERSGNVCRPNKLESYRHNSTHRRKKSYHNMA